MILMYFTLEMFGLVNASPNAICERWADAQRGERNVFELQIWMSQDDAKKHWDALHVDPVFLPYRSAAVPLITR